MFNIGDEVLVKGKITAIVEKENYPFKVRFADFEYVFFKEEELIPAEKTYTQGSAEAWALAKKLFVEYKESDLDMIFGKTWSFPKLMELTPEEARAKIETFEKGRRINERCIVETLDGLHKGVVTLVRTKGDFFVLWDNGTADVYEEHEVRNTGGTAEGLDFLLRQIGG